MRIGSTIGRGWVRLGRSDFELSVAARRRLKWMDYYRGCGCNASDLPAFRYQCADPLSVVAPLQAARLAHAREPLATAAAFAPVELERAALEQAVLKLRCEDPRWGKDKLAVPLRGAGHAVSVSMV
jgi:hypothetical protein